MNLSDVQSKEIVSIVDGKKIGNVVDANVDISSGKINYFVAEQRRLFKRIFGSGNAVKFTFDNIEKIGKDVILIRLWYN